MLSATAPSFYTPIESALEALRELQGRLNTYHLKTQSDIDGKIKKILSEHQCQKWLDYKLHSHVEYKTRYKKKGRPQKTDRGRTLQRSYFSLSFGIAKEAVEKEALTDGVFPLITHVEKDHTPKKILEIYKYQPFLEKRHSQLKTWQQITPVLLKKDERVVALLHMHVMALMVSTLIERKIRLSMKKQKIKSLPIYPEGKPCQYPTMFNIVRFFNGVERYEVEDKNNVSIFPVQLSPLQKQILNLLDVPTSLYD